LELETGASDKSRRLVGGYCARPRPVNDYFRGADRTHTMYLNIDKAFLGLLLLVFVIRPYGNKTFEFNWLRVGAIVLIVQIALMIPLALASGYVRFEPKIPPETLIWMINNLVIVSVAEESFFRGFIQTQLSKEIGWFAILLAAIIFGLAHHRGGPTYVALATVSGLFYGTAYHKTQRIESSIFAHFLFNSAHFLLFSYPALA
jgi:CAAX protease family protein